MTVEEWEEQFGRSVRRLRQTTQLTQVELAARANVSLSALKNLERGRGSSLSSVVRVARALGRAEWLDSFAPVQSEFSPLAMLANRVTAARPRRVRHPVPPS
ncbi:MAG: helix-turn-helix transcriptional regulator [Acidobacteria bacterium]|nr:helix-turn-helix transcriptional regulator [Acidobacteriota bacterium]